MRHHSRLPEKLYKYQPLSPRALDNLRKGLLWFSNPHLHFNDPFDCLAVLIKAQIADQEIQDERIGSKNTDRNITEFLLEGNLSAQLQCRIWNDVSVACFAEEADDMLMWSHYADGHKGFCLEFDTSFMPFTLARPIVYREAFPKVKLSQAMLRAATNDELVDSLLGRMLLTKHKAWRYEREWRIVRGEHAHAEEFDNRAITAVYMGAKMPWQKHDAVRSVTKLSKPTYKIMFRLPQKFAVSPSPVTFGSGS